MRWSVAPRSGSIWPRSCGSWRRLGWAIPACGCWFLRRGCAMCGRWGRASTRGSASTAGRTGRLGSPLAGRALGLARTIRSMSRCGWRSTTGTGRLSRRWSCASSTRERRRRRRWRRRSGGSASRPSWRRDPSGAARVRRRRCDGARQRQVCDSSNAPAAVVGELASCGGEVLALAADAGLRAGDGLARARGWPTTRSSNASPELAGDFDHVVLVDPPPLRAPRAPRLALPGRGRLPAPGLGRGRVALRAQRRRRRSWPSGRR